MINYKKDHEFKMENKSTRIDSKLEMLDIKMESKDVIVNQGKISFFEDMPSRNSFLTKKNSGSKEEIKINSSLLNVKDRENSSYSKNKINFGEKTTGALIFSSSIKFQEDKLEQNEPIQSSRKATPSKLTKCHKKKAVNNLIETQAFKFTTQIMVSNQEESIRSEQDKQES